MDYTWVPATVAKLLRTATASTATEGDDTVAILEGGGIGNQQPKKFWPVQEAVTKTIPKKKKCKKAKWLSEEDL